MNLPTWMFAKQNFKNLILTSLNYFRQPFKTSESSEYRVWRDRFLNQRLKLCLLLAFPCLLTYTLNDLVDSQFSWNRWIEADFVRIFLTTICGFLFKTKWIKCPPKLLLLCLSWSITMLPSLWMILRGLAAPSDTPLNMVFISQTTLMPIYWQIHLASQLGAIISHWIGVFFDKEYLQDFEIGFSCIYWFWISFICTLAVYLYERLQQQEFESRRELNVFLHAVSHDMRAPVMGTSIVLQNLLKKAQKINSGRILIDSTVLAKLLQGSDRQLKMINSLLEAQSTANLGIKLNWQPCHLDQLIISILTELEPILEQNGVVVKNKITGDLPMVNADPLQLWRVLNNLINNAIQHNPDGIELTVDAVVEPDLIRVYIIDNGVGIAIEQQARLFELYARGDRARYMPGLGMGLYLCQQIIIAHGGEIGFDSYPGKGSSFWFTLPIFFYSTENGCNLA
jgi:signal transduction histidine kinase